MNEASYTGSNMNASHFFTIIKEGGDKNKERFCSFCIKALPFLFLHTAGGLELGDIKASFQPKPFYDSFLSLTREPKRLTGLRSALSKGSAH